eukprot:m.153040 g.153040  ORF g.153040 m.153040 type:complete len:314 (-) comp15063_c0_seq2:5033-5974(-)
MPSQNPFGGLVVEDDDDVGEETMVLTRKPKSVPEKAPSKQVRQDSAPPSRSKPSEVTTDVNYEGDTRGRGRGRNRGRGGRGGGGGGGSRDHRSKRGPTKPDEKRSGHGTGNWGSNKDDIVAPVAATEEEEVRDTEAEAEDASEEVQISYEEHLRMKDEARSKVPTLKKERKAGEDDGGAGYKVAGKQLEREEIDPIIVGGKDKAKKTNSERKGRAAKTQNLQVDFKFSNENSQMETREARRDDSRGKRTGRGEGRRDSRGRGRGREGGRGRGRGEGRGRGRDGNGTVYICQDCMLKIINRSRATTRSSCRIFS